MFLIYSPDVQEMGSLRGYCRCRAWNMKVVKSFC